MVNYYRTMDHQMNEISEAIEAFLDLADSSNGSRTGAGFQRL